MNEINSHLDDIKKIRQLMERSSQFVSLSGLSGVFSGIVGIAAASIAYYLIYGNQISVANGSCATFNVDSSLLSRLELLGGLAILVAFSGGVFFTVRKSRKFNLPIWSKTSKQFMVNLAIPLVAGGIFCITLITHQNWELLAPSMLLFYGSALINAGHFTQNDIRFLGFTEVALGLLAAVFTVWGLLFWALGFGLAHIVYGTIMYKKYQ